MLAAEQSPETISITHLAQTAGVHRSTVYEHAESTEQLLRQAIISELDDLYSKYNTIEDSGVSQHEALEAILQYLERNERLYRRMSDASGAVIAEALSSHTSDIMLGLWLKQGVAQPKHNLGLDERRLLEITTRAVTDAIVRVLSEWLALPAPRDPRLAAQMIRLVLPAWWATEQ